MNKISITLDVSKINKAKIETRSYVNREGVPVVVKEYKLDLVPLKQAKIIKSGNDWDLKKTHFAVEAQTKEERAAKKESVFVGEGLQFVSRGEAGVDPDAVTAF